ncbi:MAG: hypothetical protein ACM3S1_06450, partial [Hyphomicrobiales bacterium]
ALVAVVALLARGLGAPRERERDGTWMLLEVSVVMLAMQVYGPLTEGEHLVMLFPALAAVVLLAAGGELRPVAGWIALAAWAAFAVGYLSPIKGLAITSTSLAPTAPSGAAILLTGRLTFLLAILLVVSCDLLARRAGYVSLAALLQRRFAVRGARTPA